MAKKRGIFLLLILLLAGTAGAGFWWWRSGQREQPVNEITVYGNVDIRQVELAFNGSERITDMFVEEGDRVTTGQLLAQLETDRLAQAVARARAQVEAQTQLVARLEAGSRPQEIEQARAEMEAAAAEAENALRIYERRRPLAKSDALSREQAENAKTAADAAQAKLRAATQALELALEGPRKEDIAAAKATLHAYRAALDLEQRRLADAYLHAPTEAVIQNRILQPGDMASPQRAVFTLALTDPVWVRAYVSEPDLGRIRPGMAARVQTDSYPGKQYKAWIGYISPTAEFTPKTVETTDLRTKLVYEIRVYACNPANELRLGMPATVSIALDQQDPESKDAPHLCQEN